MSERGGARRAPQQPEPEAAPEQRPRRQQRSRNAAQALRAAQETTDRMIDELQSQLEYLESGMAASSGQQAEEIEAEIVRIETALSVLTGEPLAEEEPEVGEPEAAAPAPVGRVGRQTVRGRGDRMAIPEDRNLEPGTHLVGTYRGVDYHATVERDAQGIFFKMGEQEYNSLSAMGSAVTQGPINGWRFWFIDTSSPQPQQPTPQRRRGRR